jgi:hypothetical protein
VARLESGGIGIRDSKSDAPHFTYSAEEFSDFVKGVKAGEFDDLC